MASAAYFGDDGVVIKVLSPTFEVPSILIGSQKKNKTGSVFARRLPLLRAVKNWFGTHSIIILFATLGNSYLLTEPEAVSALIKEPVTHGVPEDW